MLERGGAVCRTVVDLFSSGLLKERMPACTRTEIKRGSERERKGEKERE